MKYHDIDEKNAPINRAGRSPEMQSAYKCPECGRHLVLFLEDQLYYCRACEIEYSADDLESVQGLK